MQEPFNCSRDLRRRAPIADWSRNILKFAHRAAETEVVCVHHFRALLDFLALKADIGNPVLAAGIGAARDVKSQLLIETRNAIFKFVHQPARESLCLRDGELAELRAGASDRAAPKR